jgi:predicted nucleotidyltransferase
MKSLIEIQKALQKNKQELFVKYPIKSMAIFGSYARNQQQEKSDLDLLVEFNGQIGIRFIDLAEEIENLTELKVDLVSKNGIKDKYFNAISKDLINV